MSKKYLSLEEAAEHLGISTTELNRLREKGAIRAFADRGTWKFKEDDVVTLARNRQTDSNPDVPLAGHDDSSVLDDDALLGNQATVIRKSISDEGSDSDVRLSFDESMEVSSSPSAILDDSDSDVKLAGAGSSIFTTGSDSDVKLVTDEIPVADSSGSDSDVRLVSSDSSGDVQLTATDDGSSQDVLAAAGSSILAGDSGISLSDPSHAPLVSDSGISLESPADSGISLSGEGSILLEADSGISLGEISLKSDSGISLAPEKPAGKKPAGKKPGADDDLSGTSPLMDSVNAGDEDLLDTQMEVPSLDDSSESHDLFDDSSTGDSTNVITLDDEDSSGYDVTADIAATGGTSVSDEEEIVSAEDDSDSVEISDDLIGEDDELSEDVFGAEDEDFDADDIDSGESSVDLPVSSRAMAAAVEQDWGTGMHVTLWITTVLTVVSGGILFDFIRNMWYSDVASRTPMSTVFVDLLKGM